MAARVDEPQPVVRDATVQRVHVDLQIGGLVPGQLAQLGGTQLRPPDPVDRPVPRGGGQPGPWAVRDPVAPPGWQRRGERLLRTLLGQVPVPEYADERGDNPPPVVAKRLSERLLDVTHGPGGSR